MREAHVPGVSIALIEHGTVTERWYAGMRRHGHTDPVSAHTRFQAGSISKSVAAACALRLVADGRLDLDEHVDDRLSSWRIPANDGWRPRTTLRQLLSHTAGTSVHGFPGYPHDMPVPTVPQLLDGQGNTPPVQVTSLPGLQYSYSGGGYTIMQQLLVDVTGQDFAALAAELVLGPVGMRDSTYAQPLPAELADSAATGHYPGPVPLPGDWHTYPEQAAAGLWTTATDLARFFIALRDSVLGRPGALLPQRLAEQMATPHATNARYGLGLQLADEGAPASIGHAGDNQGFVNWGRLFLESGQGLVVMTNSDWGRSLIGEVVVPAVRKHYSWPDGAAAPEPEHRTAAELAGRYRFDGGELRLRAVDDELELLFGSQPPLRLARGTDGDWHARAVNVDLRFRGEELTLHQEAEYSTDITAQRGS